MVLNIRSRDRLLVPVLGSTKFESQLRITQVFKVHKLYHNKKLRSPNRESYISVSAATPGNTFPSKSSKLAPPPVDMCETLSPNPA